MFGCAQAPQFSTADLGTRPAHSYLQFNNVAVNTGGGKTWEWDQHIPTSSSTLQTCLFVSFLEKDSRPQTTTSVQQGTFLKTRSYTVRSTFTLKLAMHFVRFKKLTNFEKTLKLETTLLSNMWLQLNCILSCQAKWSKVSRPSFLCAVTWVDLCWENSRGLPARLGTGIGLLNQHAKKGSKMVVMMDLGQNLFPSTASFDASFCFHLYYVMCRC